MFTRDSVSSICKVAALEAQKPGHKRPRGNNMNPGLAALQMKTKGSERAWLRRKGKGPRCVDFRVGTARSEQPELCGSAERSGCKESEGNGRKPGTARPETSAQEPVHEEVCKDSDASGCPDCNAEGDELACAKLRSSRLKPACAALKTGTGSPNLPSPETKAMRPGWASDRSNEGSPI